MHVMFVDMNVDKRLDHDSNVVHEIVRVDVPLMSCPPHVAPGVTATVYVYGGTSGNDRLHLMARRGPRPQIEFAVVWVTAALDAME